MTGAALNNAVSALMQSVAQEVILPRYQNLAAHEVIEKAKNDLVTIADRESEARLSEGLARLLPEALIVGEEACAADPALLDGLASELCWIIDPIDGTGNFAAGRAPFGVIIALAERGVPVAGWIYDPLEQRMCHAARGQGATINGQRIAARESGAELPLAGISTLFLNPQERADIEARLEGQLDIVSIPRCAAEQYPRIVLGQNDLALFKRTLAWDHAAGVLFLNEAGGMACRFDGAPYLASSDATGMLAAASPAMWDKAAGILFG
ncbi:inositol monophosphatase [Sphingobium sp. DEHP117]|uniref:inositol monophosphatase family protein n=1 Tax=Sphingobium sp. DEHP117 TaxID=2993436 RepID=UPI0027D6C607|nr:inositol monophosphatase family protein [Sphingobium sp. DEHP117]MDQ4419652.1 inositol monophosphatase [Sphingobium sp. DEHP117]